MRLRTWRTRHAATSPPGTEDVTDTRVALVVIPEPVRSMVRAITMPYDVPEATDDLRMFVDGLDPHTTPDAEDLVDVILVWIATAEPSDPRLPAWTDYARDATRRLHRDDHYRARRAALAHTAFRAGILAAREPDGTRHLQLQHVIQCIAHTGEPTGGHDTPLSHLSTYLMLHAHGHCDQAIAEVTRLLRTCKESLSPETQPSIVIVLISMLTACGRAHDAARILEALAGIVGPSGSRLRDLIALCAITITDIITAAHAPVCISGRPVSDRHRWSAMLHGEHPDQHLCVPPARDAHRSTSGPAGAGSWYALDLTELPERLSDQLEHAHDTVPTRYPGGAQSARAVVAHLWLVCRDCHLALLLGETSVLSALPGRPIVPVTLHGAPVGRHPTMGRAVWRMLHEHLGHRLCAVTDRSAHWRQLTATATAFISTSGGTDGASHADYAHGWPQQPVLADYRGATPQPLVAQHQAETYLICTSCGLELVLGGCAINPDHPRVPIISDTDPASAVQAVLRLVTDHTGHDLLLLADDVEWESYFS